MHLDKVPILPLHQLRRIVESYVKEYHVTIHVDGGDDDQIWG